MLGEAMGPGWTASGDDWDAGRYDRSYSFVWRHGADLVEVLAPRPGERVLDLGCGTGHLTARIAAAGAEVVGIDKAPSMIEQARRNYPDVRFEVADGADFRCAEPLDAVFSNAALHWMKEPEEVVACISRALRPGGRLVAELGGKGNVAAIVGAIRAAMAAAGHPAGPEINPWYFPSIAEYGALLERRGLRLTYAALFDRPTPLAGEGGLRDWLGMFAGQFLGSLPPDVRPGVARDVEARLRPMLFRDGAWHGDYRRLRVVAVKG